MSLPLWTDSTYPHKEHIHKYSTTDSPASNDFHLNRSEQRWFPTRSWLNKERCDCKEASDSVLRHFTMRDKISAGLAVVNSQGIANP